MTDQTAHLHATTPLRATTAGTPRAVNNLAVHAIAAAGAANHAIVDEIAERIVVTESGHD